MTAREEYSVPLETAIEMLDVIPDYDPGGEGGPGPCVHDFLTSSFGLLGAHMRLDEAVALMREHGVEEAGPTMTAMRHGLVVMEPGEDGSVRPRFFATKAVAE